MMQFMSVVRVKSGFTSVRMRNWSVGISIIVLTLIFFIRYEHSDHKLPTNHSVDDSSIEGESVHEPAKKPHFMTLEDLDYLFSNKSISVEEEEEASNGLRVWSRMRPFLERPDALPETAQGIEEARLAMKDLVFLISKEKEASSVLVSKGIRRNCPDFVTSFDGDLSGLRPVLELPCGLVEDSSITLVGIPDEHSRSFQIQLVGSGISGETRRPIILRYNVNFSKPSIVQNTWTEKLGWGKEVRCPSFKNKIGNKTLAFTYLVPFMSS